MSIMEKALEIQDVIVKDRRYLHENAEVHDELPITTAYVIKRLKEMGYEPEEISKSAVVATVGGKKPGKVFLLRADMDALPIEEETDLEFKSKTSNMHACGHDLHTSMLLGAAKILKDYEDDINGTVKLMFQPAEETLVGAKEMVDAGVLEDPKVDAAMMIHVFAGLEIPSGMVMFPSDGVASASSDWFKIDIIGKGCHGAMPNMGVDPLNVLSHLHIALQEINSRELVPGDMVALTIGEMHGGNTSNVIPDTAYMSGTIRTMNKETRKFIKERLVEMSNSVANTFRASAKVTFSSSCPSVIIDKDLREQIIDYTQAALGAERVLDLKKINMQGQGFGSEDFAFVSEKVPSVIVGLGAGAPSEGYIYPQHHPKIKFNEDVLHIGAAVYAEVAMKWLENNI